MFCFSSILFFFKTQNFTSIYQEKFSKNHYFFLYWSSKLNSYIVRSLWFFYHFQILKIRNSYLNTSQLIIGRSFTLLKSIGRQTIKFESIKIITAAYIFRIGDIFNVTKMVTFTSQTMRRQQRHQRQIYFFSKLWYFVIVAFYGKNSQIEE